MRCFTNYYFEITLIALNWMVERTFQYHQLTYHEICALKPLAWDVIVLCDRVIVLARIAFVFGNTLQEHSNFIVVDMWGYTKYGWYHGRIVVAQRFTQNYYFKIQVHWISTHRQYYWDCFLNYEKCVFFSTKLLLQNMCWYGGEYGS